MIPELPHLPNYVSEHAGDLPAHLSSFIGRVREIETLRALLGREEIRLLTLTGAGGSGKTRLAVEVARRFAGEFEDGVRFVGLAAISESGLVAGAIARALGIQLPTGESAVDSLIYFLRTRHLLLVLDNFEHLLSSAPLVYRMLANCSRLKVLVTSRTVLRLSGEHSYAVLPFQVPENWAGAGPEQLGANEAISLFVERAQAAQFNFELGADNAQAVAELCKRVDGLPLAIELAAARIRLLPPQTLLVRLDHRLPMLTGGARDLPRRQQTLRDAIAWSYDLLTPDEQRLLRRLAVFAGGWSLEALVVVEDGGAGVADGVNPGSSAASAPSQGTLDLLETLVAASLVTREETGDGQPRFRMLQTIREYASERLGESGEAPMMRERHAGFYLALAEQTTQIGSAVFPRGLLLLDRDLDNLRAALACCLAEPGLAAMGMRLAAALAHRYWQVCGGLSEGRGWLERALAGFPDAPRPLLAEVLMWVGDIAEYEGEYATARSYLERSLEIWRSGPEDPRLANCLRVTARIAASQRDFDAARRFAEESLAVARRLSVREVEATAHNVLGMVSLRQGDSLAAIAHFEEGLRIAREIEAPSLIALFLQNLGWVVDAGGDPNRARALFQEALDTGRGAGDRREATRALIGLAFIAVQQEQEADAEALAEAALADLRWSGAAQDRARVLSFLAVLKCRQGDLDAARSLYAECLDACHVAGDRAALAAAMLQLAAITPTSKMVLVEQAAADRVVRLASAQLAKGTPELAARLLGISATFRWGAARPLSEETIGILRTTAATTREASGEDAFAGAVAAGRALPPADAVGEALAAAEAPPVSGSPTLTIRDGGSAHPSSPDGLTEREMEILRLIAAGMSNARIADELVLSTRTVERHIGNIYGKLGVRGRAARAAVAAYAVRQEPPSAGQ